MFQIRYFIFSDDNTVLIEGNNLDVIITSLNRELDKKNTWLKSTKLSVNVNKTHYMVWKVNHNKVFNNNSMVTQVRCSNFLGIILDNILNWISHIAYKKNGMGILLKDRKVLKTSVLHQLYYSYILPYLIYYFEV